MFSITENNYYQEQTVSSMHRAYVRHQGESAGKRERENKREGGKILSNTQDPSSLDFCFSCARINSFQNIPLWRGRNYGGPGLTLTFWRFSNPGSPRGLRGQLLPGALPGHTRCSFQDKLAGQGLSPSLFFNHLISTVPHLPNSRN